MKIVNHRLDCARQVNSPNQSPRPKGEAVSLLVIHNISLPPGQFGGSYIDDLFCNQLDCSVHEFFEEIKDLRVSSHLLIRRSGEVTQYVAFDCQAWHAGQSIFEGRRQCNEFSIGIELEGTDDDEFSRAQYSRLVEVINVLMAAYCEINVDRLTGHSDIAPGRKTDPGPKFDWKRLRKGLKE